MSNSELSSSLESIPSVLNLGGDERLHQMYSFSINVSSFRGWQQLFSTSIATFGDTDEFWFSWYFYPDKYAGQTGTFLKKDFVDGPKDIFGMVRIKGSLENLADEILKPLKILLCTNGRILAIVSVNLFLNLQSNDLDGSDLRSAVLMSLDSLPFEESGWYDLKLTDASGADIIRGDRPGIKCSIKIVNEHVNTMETSYEDESFELEEEPKFQIDSTKKTVTFNDEKRINSHKPNHVESGSNQFDEDDEVNRHFRLSVDCRRFS